MAHRICLACFYKYCLTGRQWHPLICLLSVTAFNLQQQSWTVVIDHMAHKTWNIYCLALYWKCFLTFGVVETGNSKNLTVIQICSWVLILPLSLVKLGKFPSETQFPHWLQWDINRCYCDYIWLLECI